MNLIGHLYRDIGKRYAVYEESGLFFIAPPGETISRQWLFLGAYQYDNFGRIVQVMTVPMLIEHDVEWFYHNGKQKLFVQDIDHGTRRQWNNPKHWFVPLPQESQCKK